MKIASKPWRTLPLCLLLPFAAGCGSLQAPGSGETAQVRFVALSRSSPDLDLYLNRSGVAYGLSFESFTSYLPVSAGSTEVAAHRTGREAVLSAAEYALAAGRHYTVLLTHAAASPEPHLFADQEGPAADGHTLLRVINGSSRAHSLTFFVTPSVVAGDDLAKETALAPVATFRLAANTASEYVSLSAKGDYTVEAVTPGEGVQLPLRSVSLHAAPGAVRSVVFGDAPALDSTPPARHALVGFVLPESDQP